MQSSTRATPTWLQRRRDILGGLHKGAGMLVQSRAVDDENLEGVRGRQSSQALLRGFGPRRAQNRAVLRRTLLPLPRRYEKGAGMMNARSLIRQSFVSVLVAAVATLSAYP